MAEDACVCNFLGRVDEGVKIDYVKKTWCFGRWHAFLN